MLELTFAVHGMDFLYQSLAAFTHSPIQKKNCGQFLLPKICSDWSKDQLVAKDQNCQHSLSLSFSLFT